MVRCNRIDDVFGFIVLAENVRADCGMGAFDFMVDGFSDIVEKTDPARFLFVKPEFRGDGAHERGGFDGVFEHVLREAETELESAEQGDDLFRHPLNAAVENRFFSGVEDLFINLLADLFDEFLNAGRVNAPVGNEFFQQTARDFLADRVKAGNDDRFRRIVDQDVDARGGFQSADIASLASMMRPFISSLGSGIVAVVRS